MIEAKPVREFRIWEAQRAYLDSPARFRGFVGGRGAGKSLIGAYDLLARAEEGRLYLVAAPTYPMLRDSTLRTFLSVARATGIPVDYYRAENRAVIDGAAEVLFRSTDDPERLRGPNLSGVWFDEASLMVPEAYEIAIATLREGGRMGWLGATFTPKGRSHWTYEVFATDRPDTELVRARTLDNPFLPVEFEQTIRQQYSGLLADQELEGLFVDVEGAEWPGTYFPDSMWFDEWPTSGISLKVMSLDPSKGRADKPGDYSAFVLLALDRDGHLWVEADLLRAPTPQLVEDGIAHYLAFNPSAVCTEANQFQEMLASEFLTVGKQRRLAMPLYTVTNFAPKVMRIRTLGPYLARGELHFRRTKGTELLVNQLRDFPEGEHDDGPDALEMAIRMLWHMMGRKSTLGDPKILRV